ncbi:unnamed protein product [Mesocestoides corti]|uniref:Cadherin domain-containing protein n=1 Tax=Mesocestoides corti TaxID=53468 RepID=A0A158QTV3_MESCO|nr:unnamed protein product [Mesocestoides corti]
MNVCFWANICNSSEVGKVHAIDRDADPKNNRVRYHINDEGNTAFLDGVRASRFFSITPTGEIYTNPIPIDREQVSILTFSVVAIDSGEPPLSAFATVVIRVEDINDNGPQWVYPLPCPQATSINISAYSTVGMIVARLEAIDPDIGVNGQVEYEIIRGNGQNYFDLDRHSGTLYLKKSLELGAQSNSTSDHASPTSFALSLKATDGGDPPRSNVSILRILVQTMDVFPPDFTSNDGGRSHRKNQQFSANGYLKQQGNYVDRDLLVMIVMIIITLLVSVLLIMAIVLLRCRQIHSTRETGIDPQTGSGGAGGVGIMRVAQIKPHPWLPPPSHDSSAKSGFTVDSSKSGNAPFDGHAQYMTSSDQFVASDATLKSIEGVPVAGTYDRFSPAVIVSTSTFQRPNQNSDPSSVGTFVYTSKHVGDNTNPCYIRQVCATLPNNATARPLTDASGRCYMTLNPELYEIEHPYGQLKYHSGAYQSPGRGPKTAGISAMIKSTPNIGEVESSAAVECVRSVEPPMVEIQKRCRFKIDSSGSRPLLASNTPIFDKSESTEETVDGEMELESMQMKRLRTSCNSVGPEDSLLVNIH